MTAYRFLLLAAASLILGLILGLALLWGGGKLQEKGTQEAVAQPQGRLTIYDLERFQGYPVYWLGETYQGLPLTDISYVRDAGPPDGSRPPVEYVALIYGTCDVPEGAPPESAACVPPVQVMTEPFCLNRPSWLAQRARGGPPFDVRGGLAQQTESGNLHLYTGDETILVFTTAGEQATLEAAMVLRGANVLGQERAPSAGAVLGPPMPEEGCQGVALSSPVPPAP